MRMATLFLSALLLTVPAARAGAQVNCETARCTFDAAVSRNCSCTKVKNHGQYVSCVAHLVKALSACSNVLPPNCKGKVTRCAARSTCGKSDFSTCTPTCVTDPSTGAMTCSNDSSVTCTTDADCGACHTRRTGTCPAWTTESTGSCCSTCPAPTCSASPASEPGCPCNGDSDCASGKCCAAAGVCG